MDIPRVVIIGTDFRSVPHDPVSNRRIMTDVVVLDQTEGQVVQPLLYQLSEEIAELLEQDPGVQDSMMYHEQEPFMLVGEILSIDREKKLITLTNNNQLAYKYLIVASGASSHQTVGGESDAFTPGVSTLIEALKIRREGLSPSTPARFASSKESVRASTKTSQQGQQALLDVMREVSKEINSPHSAERFSSSHRRLFEVQL